MNRRPRACSVVLLLSGLFCLALPARAAGPQSGPRSAPSAGVPMSNGAGRTAQPVLEVPHSDLTLDVGTPLPDATRPGKSGAWSLVPIGAATASVPVQLGATPTADGSVAGEAARLMAAVPPSTDASGPRRFRLQPVATAGDGADHFEFKAIGDTGLGLWEGQNPVLVYNHGVVTGPHVPESDHRRQRACYIHPLWGLNGEVLTDDFPKDHYHHHGIFWTWLHVGIEEREYDLWAGARIKQKFVRWICRESGPITAVLAVENGWFVDDRQVMIERVWVRVFAASGNGRSLDITLFLIPVGKPVTLWGAEGKSYGGLTMRFAPRLHNDTRITVPSGRTTEDLPNTRLEWADMTATFGAASTPSGAAIFVDPRNRDVPHAWLTRHYGILCIGWPGVEPKTLPPGRPVRLDYRIWVHKQVVDLADLKRVYDAYTAATKVAWE